MGITSIRPALVLTKLLVVFCLAVAPAAGLPLKGRRESVTRLVLQIQRADYEGDRAALKRLYEAMATFAADKELGARVGYWRGFALWRRALNGFNDSADRSELEHDLKQAVTEFDQSAAKDPGFTDAKIGAASCLLNLVFLYQKDQARINEFLSKALPLLEEAKKAEPDNPRLLWVLGASRWAWPPGDGAEAAAIALYNEGLKAARKRRNAISDPLMPSWGEPELLMNLAWSNLNRSAPDPAAAEEYARSALALVPYWHYVKDILIPQIAAVRTRPNK